MKSKILTALIGISFLFTIRTQAQPEKDNIQLWLKEEKVFLKQKIRSKEALASSPEASNQANTTKEITSFASLLNQLPPAQDWTRLREEHLALLPDKETKPFEFLDWQLIHYALTRLTQSDGDPHSLLEQAAKINESIDSIQVDEYPLYQLQRDAKELNAQLTQDQSANNAEDRLQAFIKRVETYLPINRDQIAKELGGLEKLTALENFKAECEQFSESLQQKYPAIFTGDTSDKEMLKEYEQELQQFLKIHAEVHQIYNESIANPVVLRYFSNQNENKALSHDDYIALLDVPDLVTLAGASEAEVILNKILLNCKVIVLISKGAETQKLALKLAVRHSEKLLVPQWYLAHNPQATDFFEILEKRFGATVKAKQSKYSGIDQGYKQALFYYAMGLLIQNKTDDALAAFKQFKSDSDSAHFLEYNAAQILRENGYSKQAWALFHSLIQESPQQSRAFWEFFIQLSSDLNEQESLQKLLLTLFDQKTLPESERIEACDILAQAYLSNNDLESAYSYLEKALNHKASTEEQFEQQRDLAQQLYTLGKLLNNKDYIQVGLLKIQEFIPPYENDKNTWQNRYYLSSLVNSGLTEIAEPLLDTAFKALQATEKKIAEKTDSSEYIYFNHSDYDELLILQAQIYSERQEYDKIIHLLETSPHFSQPNLSDFLKKGEETELAYYTAQALHQTGHHRQALPILEAILFLNSGNDRYYELYFQIKGTEAIPFLEKLYALDQFEERPLIWKAKLLLDDGQLQQALEVANLAIAIDPSDGEQRKGDRMRAYSILKEIHQKMGEQEKSSFLEGVVKAIRLSEEADLFYNAGLHRKAIEMYQESLEFFADAYCIQSRLAIQLSKLGLHKQASKHYEKAYTLMPDSFGRVESHCFGCEKAFDGEQPQAIAEKIFQKYLEKNPQKPQIHYLLGYLRENQERDSEALTHYQTAVALDPDYLNAWQRITGITKRVYVAPNTLDQIHLKLLKLDPLGKHTYLSLKEINDYRLLWDTLHHNEKLQHQFSPPQDLFEFKASKTAIESKITNQDYMRFLSKKETPGQRLLENRSLELIATMLENSGLLQATQF